MNSLKNNYTKGKKEEQIKVPGQHEKVMSETLQGMQVEGRVACWYFQNIPSTDLWIFLFWFFPLLWENLLFCSKDSTEYLNLFDFSKFKIHIQDNYSRYSSTDYLFDKGQFGLEREKKAIIPWYDVKNYSSHPKNILETSLIIVIQCHHHFNCSTLKFNMIRGSKKKVSEGINYPFA